MTSVELNITELCNMKCVFCPRAVGYENQNLHMSMETVDLIISQLDQIPNLKNIYFAGRSEPTLHNNFNELAQKFIEYRDNHRPNLKLLLTTNGARVVRYHNTTSQFNQIAVSIYDEEKERKASIKEKYKNWPNVVIHDKRTRKKPPSDGIWFTFNNRAGSVITQFTHHHTQDFYHPKLRLMCEKPFDVLYISWNGDYNLCCNDWEDIQVLGNIYSESIFEYTNYNERLLEYQIMLAKGSRNISPCSNCNRKIPEWYEEEGLLVQNTVV
jgi:organic radical activating enzyme